MLTHKWELACNFFVRATVLRVLWLTEERVLHAIWPEWCCWRMNCRICANHPDSGWLAAKSTWIALELISWRHNRKRAIEVLLETKNATWMQNNPKTELHMRSDPQMKSYVQLFWSIVTINIFSTIIILEKPICILTHQWEAICNFFARS